MYNHADQNYICPICLGVAGIENEHTLLKHSDVVCKDELVTVFINSFFVGKNPGHTIVVPNTHFENIYDLPTEYAHHIFDVAKKVALAMKRAYGCDGIMTQQNNEPASGQHALHYHLHIFPRYENDDLHEFMGQKKLAPPEERAEYAQKLKKNLSHLFQ